MTDEVIETTKVMVSIEDQEGRESKLWLDVVNERLVCPSCGSYLELERRSVDLAYEVRVIDGQLQARDETEVGENTTRWLTCSWYDPLTLQRKSDGTCNWQVELYDMEQWEWD